MLTESIAQYQSGDYLEKTGGTWHLEDAGFKADLIMQMLRRHKIPLATIADIGCGSGGVLAELRDRLSRSTLVGYEVSPQAHAISQRFERENLRYVLGDVSTDEEVFDLVMAIDVAEHVEDCFGFLRKVKQKGRHQLYHIPLDISCSAALRDSFMWGWEAVGHIHVFTKSLALATLRATGHEIVDCFYTKGDLTKDRRWKTRATNSLRRIVPDQWGARLLGGYSLMVLTR